jgi:SAM-dependent methyltransferase
MSLVDYYEESYFAERLRPVSDFKDEVITSSKVLFNYVVESKNRFLGSKNWKDLKVIELGSGRGGVGLQLAQLGAQVTLVDFSQSALDQARSLFELEGLEVKTVVGDLTYPDIELASDFDILVDSHLLHCITDDAARASYYRLVLEHLRPGGIFVAETMVHRKKIYIPDGFMFDENYVLWQMFGKWTAVRRILDSLDLEKELNTAGFHIAYFYYYGQYGFVPHRSFMDIPAEILPAAVRMVLQKK